MIAVRSGLLWLEPQNRSDEDLVEEMKARYTVDHPAWVAAVENGFSTQDVPRWANFWIEDGARVGFPREVPWDEDFDDGTVLPDGGRRFGQTFKPREGQEEAVAAAVAHLGQGHSGILRAKCGGGKTVLGIETIRRLGLPAVVLVHKDFLMRQWTEEAQKFMPGCRVGYIRAGRADSGADHDIVIAMVQSLLAREYPREVYESFGVLVADEVHRHGAPDWNKAMGMFPAKLRLGLTATPDRHDGLHDLVYSHIGPIFHHMPVKPLETRLGVRYPQWEVAPARYVLPWNRKPNLAKLINALVEITPRTDMMVADIVRAVEAGRRAIVLSGRRNHVDEMVAKLAVQGVRASRFVGGMDEVEQKAATKAEAIVGTYPMAKEGLDVPDRDTLFLATPVSDVEQAVGRIQREHEDKKQPLVVDYVDRKVWLCQALFKARCRVYARLGVRRDP